MSYCVHCGVRLESSEKHCPLCRTPVLDPAALPANLNEKKYPPRDPAQEIHHNRQLLLILISFFLVVPACICLLCDWIFTPPVSWSLYPFSALLLVFLSVLIPSLSPRKKRPVIICTTVFLSLNFFLFLVEQISGSSGWFFQIVFPALTALFLMITLLVRLKKKDRLNRLTLVAAVFLVPVMEALLVEALISVSLTGFVRLVWSLFVLIPCLFLSVSLFLLNGNRSLREEVRRHVRF